MLLFHLVLSTAPETPFENCLNEISKCGRASQSVKQKWIPDYRYTSCNSSGRTFRRQSHWVASIRSNGRKQCPRSNGRKQCPRSLSPQMCASKLEVDTLNTFNCEVDAAEVLCSCISFLCCCVISLSVGMTVKYTFTLYTLPLDLSRKWNEIFKPEFFSMVNLKLLLCWIDVWI